MFKKIILSMFAIFIANTACANDTKASLETLKKNLAKYGTTVKLEGTEKAGDKTVPGLYFGNKKINNNYDVVDEVKKRHGGSATIFVKVDNEYVRITTNIIKAEDGTRAVGTTLAHNKAYENVNKGEIFCGEVEILNLPYDTCYDPIKDANGKVIGIYYVGFKK